MKIEYKFVTGTVEVEVPDDWGALLVDLDRQEYNNDHRETRRHCSLEAYNLDDALLPSDEDVVRDILKAEDDGRLHEALSRLDADQRELIDALYFEGIKAADFAKQKGVSPSAITQRKATALKKLKRFLS